METDPDPTAGQGQPEGFRDAVQKTYNLLILTLNLINLSLLLFLSAAKFQKNYIFSS